MDPRFRGDDRNGGGLTSDKEMRSDADKFTRTDGGSSDGTGGGRGYAGRIVVDIL